MTKKILTVFGTRPEVIKLAPFIKEIESNPNFTSVVCATSQHEKLQNDFVQMFGVHVDYDLEIMRPGQDLFHISEKILSGIKHVLEKEKPDYVAVQGDTSTVFTAALAAYYMQIPVIHLEAGLRTGNIYGPFPEEANRTLVSRIASYHITPTARATQNLAKEGITRNVFQLGNTIVDAVDWILQRTQVQDPHLKKILDSKPRLALITAHRRENFGKPFERICRAVRELAKKYPDVTFVWPVHPNPNISSAVKEALGNLANVSLLEPLIYNDLIALINASMIILSDSGGIQEESCILKKHILILREETERPEVIDAGWGKIVGSDVAKIKSKFHERLTSKHATQGEEHIYGRPGVCTRILEMLLEDEDR